MFAARLHRRQLRRRSFAGPALAAAVAVVGLLAGCGSAGGAARTDNGGLHVVTSFYPLQFVATRIGGPPEFVPPDAGVLVDPADDDALAAALQTAAALPCPNPAARAAAEAHDVRRQAEKVEAILERAVRGPRA